MPPRFHCALPLASLPASATLALDAASAQHVRVLRLAVGDAITLFNGIDNGQASAIIRAIDKCEVQVEMSGWQPVSRESPLDIVLLQSLATGDKMDLIVQKAVELGVSAIQPMRSARSTLKLDGERADKRVAHWQAVAIAACEQCGRNIVPSVAPIASFAIFNETRHSARHLGILHPEIPADIGVSNFTQLPTQPFARWLRANAGQPVGVMVGPEGGFSDAEVAQAVAAGATLVAMGARVLRTETAGLAALAIAQALAGDLGGT